VTTFSIVEHSSVAASGVAAGVIASVKDGILDAAEIWNRYFAQASFDISIELKFEDLSGSTLATGGTSFHFFGVEGPGQEIWKIDSMEEYVTGAEFTPGGDTIDITIKIDTPTLLSGGFFFDPDPFLRTAAIPGGESDFISIILHEIAHGLGFLGSVAGEPSLVDGPGPDITPFDDNVDLIVSDRFWVGPLATAIYGGPIPLDPGSLSHIADSGDGGFENLMDPSLTDGTRMFILPLHVAMFDDMGMPIRMITSGGDSLFGYDSYADDVDLLDGSDFYGALGGADTIDGGTGNDTVRGGEGADFIVGGAGRDSLAGDGGDDVIDASPGDDTVDGGSGKDLLTGGSGKDSLIGGNDKDTLRGGTENDTLVGGKGFDYLTSGDGADSADGGESADTLFGDAGVDTLRGGVDNDLLYGGAQRDSIFGDDGDDTVDAGTGDDVVDGGTQKDRIFTGSGFDSLIGGGGNDTLQGGNDDDTLLGGAAFDVLEGGDGNDSLEGGDFNDFIFGNAGDDTIVFNLGDDIDTLRDFTAGAGVGDVIRLVGFGAAFDTFAEVLAAATDDGLHTTIDLGGGDSLILRNVLVGDLAADDFAFG
jgi:Ca2+-binding RTX toxin-like protein